MDQMHISIDGAVWNRAVKLARTRYQPKTAPHIALALAAQTALGLPAYRVDTVQVWQPDTEGAMTVEQWWVTASDPRIVHDCRWYRLPGPAADWIASRSRSGQEMALGPVFEPLECPWILAGGDEVETYNLPGLPNCQALGHAPATMRS